MQYQYNPQHGQYQIYPQTNLYQMHQNQMHQNQMHQNQMHQPPGQLNQTHQHQMHNVQGHLHAFKNNNSQNVTAVQSIATPASLVPKHANGKAKSKNVGTPQSATHQSPDVAHHLQEINKHLKIIETSHAHASTGTILTHAQPKAKGKTHANASTKNAHISLAVPATVAVHPKAPLSVGEK